MQWKTSPTNIKEWYHWFAWHPVRIEGDWLSPSVWAWLETVERKTTFYSGEPFIAFRALNAAKIQADTKT